MRSPAPLLLALALVASPAGAETVDLLGTWHVLAHYRDSAATKPERERWEDRLWVFEMEGSRIKWTDYPIVVFADKSGRFERLGTNRATRVLEHWEPNPAQELEIQQGLEFNTRGSRTKTLRGSDDAGWTTGRPGGGAYRSARFVTFQQVWSIEGMPELPVFTWDDSMGAIGTEQLEGRTRFTTESVDPGGELLRGRYERDGTRVGTFRMTRAGTASVVKGSGKTQSERVYEAFFGELGAQMMAGDFSGEVAEAELQRMIDEGEVPEDVRREVRASIRSFIESSYRDQGNDPRVYRQDIDRLTRKVERLYLDEGKSLEEIQQMFATGQLRP